MAFFPLAFAQGSDHKPDEVIVQLKKSADVKALLVANNQSNPVLNLRLKKILSARLGIYLLGFDGSVTTPAEMVLHLNRQKEVGIAQLNHTRLKRRVNPNDSIYYKQWDYVNNGDNNGVPDADIDADEAWDLATGGVTAHGDTIVVAVIDGGFDLEHEDLDFWKNSQEIPGNNIDDDNNGYVDDVRGWNAFNGNDNVVFTGFWDSHGTHVAGTVGAKGNNTHGLVGVNWNVKVMAISGSDSDEATVIAAYGFALEHRARYNETSGAEGAYVVSTNSSFGVDDGQPANYPLWCAFYDSLGAYGIVSAGATANNDVNVDITGDIPTGCTSDYLIAVTNTDRTDTKYNQAGYGLTTIDLAAPGTQIWSSVPDNGYQQMTGTSMATPHVAGAIALMYSAACDTMLDHFQNDPAGLALLMRNYLVNGGVDQVSGLAGITVTGGRLNLKKCLQTVLSYGCNGVGYEELGAEEEKFILFPNPASDRVRIISSSDSMKEPIRFQSVIGNTVEVVKPAADGYYNISKLAPGIYYWVGTQSASGGKFVKTNN